MSCDKYARTCFVTSEECSGCADNVSVLPYFAACACFDPECPTCKEFTAMAQSQQSVDFSELLRKPIRYLFSHTFTDGDGI